MAQQCSICSTDGSTGRDTAVAAATGHTLAAEVASISAVCPLRSVLYLSSLRGACAVGVMPSLFDRPFAQFVPMLLLTHQRTSRYLFVNSHTTQYLPKITSNISHRTYFAGYIEIAAAQPSNCQVVLCRHQGVHRCCRHYWLSSLLPRTLISATTRTFQSHALSNSCLRQMPYLIPHTSYLIPHTWNRT